jgi:NADH-quinone oxidoreductase subunit F
MRELIYDFAGGIPGGRDLKAVIPGGSSVPALSPDQLDVPLDYDSLGAIGTFFGAASLIVVDDRCCMVQLALRSTKFYMHESCGKCTPCREGTRWMVQILERLESGRGSDDDIALLQSVGSRILGKSLCALGDFAVYPVASYVEKWGPEFARHVELGCCPFEGGSTLEGIVAPSDAHHSDPHRSGSHRSEVHA